jgi:transposase
MSRHVVVDWAEDADELRQRYIAERDVSRRTRLQALWLVRSGRSVTEAARLAGVGARSVERWLGWYRQGGLAVVLARLPGHGARGAPARLSPEQQQALAAQVARGTFRTCDEARQWVAEQFGVGYGYQGMYSLLTRLGLHPKVPRPMAAKADPAAQTAWKKGGWRRRWPTPG